MTIFSKIIAGEIPSYKIAENDNFYAFLDISPLAKGHTLVVPKQEVDYIFDLEDSVYHGLLDFSKSVAIGIKAAMGCKRVGIAVIGLDVPHCHIHLVPLNNANDINFAKKHLILNAEEMFVIAEKIRAKIL
ncbi:MAG: HIT family protein [Bacteroidales bacterium]|jgi:histidine triad (HIT) family protein|nr:HIT family protein [Bacteroidales bacterium]